MKLNIASLLQEALKGIAFYRDTPTLKTFFAIERLWSRYPHWPEELRERALHLQESVSQYRTGRRANPSADIVAGGAIALGIAVRRPDVLRTLVLEEPAAVAGQRSLEMQSLFASVIEQIGRGETRAAVRDFMSYVSGPGYFDSRSAECQQMLTENAAAISIGQPPPTISCADVGTVQAPILYITGELSPMKNSPLTACLPQHHSVTMNDASHAAHSDNLCEFSEAVRDFIGS